MLMLMEHAHQVLLVPDWGRGGGGGGAEELREGVSDGGKDESE